MARRIDPADRRHGQPRRSFGRRKTDVWYSVGKLAAVIASGGGAVLGQSELLGEPYRHYITVVCIACLGVAAYLLGPENVKLLWARVTRQRHV